MRAQSTAMSVASNVKHYESRVKWLLTWTHASMSDINRSFAGKISDNITIVYSFPWAFKRFTRRSMTAGLPCLFPSVRRSGRCLGKHTHLPKAPSMTPHLVAFLAFSMAVLLSRLIARWSYASADSSFVKGSYFRARKWGFAIIIDSRWNLTESDT